MIAVASKPLLTVCLITYNQAQYLKEAIDSILMQQVNFAWELVIADDCSTDGTREILLDYKKRFPKLIKLILQKNNVGAEKNWHKLISYPKSKYLAYLEGDDYWTDSDKLQSQIDFLEKNPSYELCFHPVKVLFENDEERQTIWPMLNGKTEFTINELLKENFIPSNSVVFKRQKYNNLPSGIMPGDWYLHLYNAQFGKIGFINRVMSVYRRHSGGLWWDAYKDPDKLWLQYGIQYVVLYVEMLKLYGDNDEFKKTIHEGLADILVKLAEVDKETKSKLFKETAIKYPEAAEAAFMMRHQQLKAKEAYIEDYARRTTQQVHELKHAIEIKDQEIDLIKSSKFWKLRNKVAWLLGREVI